MPFSRHDSKELLDDFVVYALIIPAAAEPRTFLLQTCCIKGDQDKAPLHLH